jgi:hypothetical protein
MKDNIISKSTVSDVRNCLYCGSSMTKEAYIVNPGAPNELRCCSRYCFEKTRVLMVWDHRMRIPLYTVLFVLIVINLVILTVKLQNAWSYLPTLGICFSAFVFPSVFASYERYRAIGIVKTRRIIRSGALLLGIFAVVSMILS